MRLGGAKYKSAIDYLETEYMDPEVEEHCKELLSQWKKDEENVKDKLDEVIKKLDDLKTSSLPPKKDSAIEGQENFSFTTFTCSKLVYGNGLRSVTT